MKILFINPPWVILRDKNIWNNVASVMPPIGVASMAAVLEKDGHFVKILDAHAERMYINDIIQWIKQNGPFEIIGISATTPLINNAIALTRSIKKELSGNTQIVLGGVHPTVLPDEVLSETTVDIVVRGEGENTISEIASLKPLQEIHGISYRNGETVIHNPERELIKNLDALPLPAYHLLPMEKYYPALGAAKRLPAISIMANRGCPGRCTFCYRIFGPRFRVRSGRNVANEVKFLQDNYGIREICFYDDTFTSIPREVKAFCKALQELKVDITWSCFSRIDTFDEETYRLMKKTGCHQVMFGVETNNNELLKNMNKSQELDNVEKVIRATKKLGINIRAAFMLGSPGETEKTMDENIRFAIRIDPDIAVFNITTPFPGTELYDWAKKNHFLKTQNWDDFDLSYPVMELPTVSSEKVLEYYNKAYKRFYFRPKIHLETYQRTEKT